MQPRSQSLIILFLACATIGLTIRALWPVGHGGGGTATNTVEREGRTTARPATMADVAGDWLAMLDRPGAIPHEAALTFKNEAAYRAFLARAEAAGLDVLGRIDGLRAVRVRFGDRAALAKVLREEADNLADVGANFPISVPKPPVESRTGIPPVAFGDRMLEFLGAMGDRSAWGRGVTIAVIDGGVSSDPTLANRVRYLDIGLGVGGSTTTDGHATAVAALAAGASIDAAGVAPAADILSIRVIGDNGSGDIFSVAQAIIAAVDAGADVINLSLGGYATNAQLQAAIAYADKAGVVLVAAAGNDQAAQLAWPAADSRVVAVGAVDATGQQAIFSNSGASLDLTAPGYAIQTAWVDGQRVYFSGTSASAPVVSGAVAAVLSTSPQLSGDQAVAVLEQYSSDGGPAGADADYGDGTLNLGWAMDRNDATRVDVAISSGTYNASAGTVDVVVQNRGGFAVAGSELTLTSDAGTATASVSSLAVGEVTTVSMPVDQERLTAEGGVLIGLKLQAPSGLVDEVPANNVRTSVVLAPAP